MPRVIKLNESDLTKIVKRVLQEQIPGTASQENMGYRNRFDLKNIDINPKKLKLGAGGKQHPEQVNDVKELQKKLINLGLLQTDNGIPTGYFGTLTDNALKKYYSTPQKSQTAPNADNKQPEQGTSFLSKTVEFCTSPFKRLGELVNSFNLTSLNPLPPHWRAFMSFLLGRTDPIRSNFFKPDELKVISDKINTYFPNSKQCKKNKKCNVSFYDNTDWSKVKTGQEKVVNPDLAKSIGFTIGNGQVIDNGNSYIVKDIYDFNNFKNNPNAYSLENASGTVKAALKKITCGNYIQGIEELASFKQAKGYKGIPVEIEIPKTL